MTLYYDHYPSPVGSLLLAATDEGLSVIAFVGSRDKAEVDEAALEKSLHKALHKYRPDEEAELKRSPSRLTPARKWLDRYFRGDEPTAKDLEMPLDLQGTPFQLKVWKQLTRIPYARTVSYGEVAKRLRQPGAARAVGLANNRNPVPILIPCHRVVGADGKLVGYGGGLWRKKALLRLEEGDLFGAV